MKTSVMQLEKITRHRGIHRRDHIHTHTQQEELLEFSFKWHSYWNDEFAYLCTYVMTFPLKNYILCVGGRVPTAVNVLYIVTPCSLVDLYATKLLQQNSRSCNQLYESVYI
jgi:hypothetical protein